MEGADYALSLSGENFKQTALSVSPTTGKVEEYQIVFTLRVSISRADGELLVDNQALRVFRDYTFDEEAALGKFIEEEGLRDGAHQTSRRSNHQATQHGGEPALTARLR